MAGDQARRFSLAHFLAQDRDHGGEQHMLFDRFGKVPGAAERLEPGSIATLTQGSEDDDAALLTGRICEHATGGLFPIHARHLHVQQDDPVWVAEPPGVAQHFQSFCPAGGCVDPAIQTLEHVSQDQAISGIIIYGQNVQTLDSDRTELERAGFLLRGFHLFFDA